MGTNKYTLFCLMAMLFILPVFGQTAAKLSPKNILLMNHFFVCNACPGTDKAKSQEMMNKYIRGESKLEAARDKIKKYFTSPGDHFVLYCKECPGTFIRYVNDTYLNVKKKTFKGFGTDISLRPGNNLKGGDEFYQINDIMLFLSDSILVFDSLHLSTAEIINRDQPLLNNIWVSYQLEGKSIERKIPYNSSTQLLTFSYQDIFGKQLSRELTDTISITLSYLTNTQQRVTAPGMMKVFFASNEEKKDMEDWIALCRKQFPQWTAEEMAEALSPMITDIYANCSMPNFTKWLSKRLSAE